MTRPRLLLVLLALALIAASCGSGGPDLRATVNSVEAIGSTSNATALGIDGSGVDAAWSAEGEPKAVADAIAAAEAPDERTDDADGDDVFLLYKSGTVWVSNAESGGSAVLLYDDNDRAYNRHSVILLRNRSWGTRVNNYRTSRSSSGSGNGFRGGGSSGGK